MESSIVITMATQVLNSLPVVKCDKAVNQLLDALALAGIFEKLNDNYYPTEKFEVLVHGQYGFESIAYIEDCYVVTESYHEHIGDLEKFEVYAI